MCPIRLKVDFVKIILQFPEGLKKIALEEAGKLEKQGYEVFLSASACFGGCDLCLDEARLVGAGKIIHFGHAEFCKVAGGGNPEVEYRPYFLEVDWEASGKMLKKAAGMLREKSIRKVSLVFPVQHVKNAVMAKTLLEKEGVGVVIGKGGKNTRYRGQVLGCDGSAADAKGADAVVYFGGGKFHPTGIAPGKPVLCADPHLCDAYWITDEIMRQEKKRKGALLAASEAKTFGILVSTKCGQMNLAAAKAAKRMIEKKGRRAAMLVANELNPIACANFSSFDAYVNTACPRIADDTEAFGKPIVNAADIKRLLELMV